MCGIVGYIGKSDARKFIINSLEKLEYRGYDSSGIACLNNNTNNLITFKKEGRVSEMKKIVDFSFPTNLGIGHTRWATHGAVNDVNSHPHSSNNKRFTIVHNGIIENANELKKQYLNNFSFHSETDTEVITNLIEFFSKDFSTKEAICRTLNILEGSYATIIIDNQDLNQLYVAKNKTPLLLGQSDHGILIGSDIMVLLDECKSYVSFDDKSFAIITRKNFEMYDINGISRCYETKLITTSKEEVSKGEFDHFMLKEIHEQPINIRKMIQTYFFNKSNQVISKNIIEDIKNSNRIYFVACGTSLNASYLGKYFMETLVSKPSEVLLASEIIYDDILFDEKPFFIILSQSGETADCIQAMKKFRNNNYKILALTNSKDSTINNLATYVLNLDAKKEIAVASTKGYTSQVVLLCILAHTLSNSKINLDKDLNQLSNAIEQILDDKETIKEIASKLLHSKSVFFIGRYLDYYCGLEASLKLKELSYIHTECFASGELKHGTIALIEQGIPVIALITQYNTSQIVRSNLQETISRGALPIVISSPDCKSDNDDYIIPNLPNYLRPIGTVVVCQLIAYYTALLLGKDIDKPRNLAKSVTVE